jgi:hypothetical protein
LRAATSCVDPTLDRTCQAKRPHKSAFLRATTANFNIGFLGMCDNVFRGRTTINRGTEDRFLPSDWLALLAICLLAVVVRASVMVWLPSILYPDEVMWIEQANRLVNHQGLEPWDFPNAYNYVISLQERAGSSDVRPIYKLTSLASAMSKSNAGRILTIERCLRSGCAFGGVQGHAIPNQRSSSPRRSERRLRR